MTAPLATGGRGLILASREATAHDDDRVIVWSAFDAPAPALSPVVEHTGLEGWVAPTFVECLPAGLDLDSLVAADDDALQRWSTDPRSEDPRMPDHSGPDPVLHGLAVDGRPQVVAR